VHASARGVMDRERRKGTQGARRATVVGVSVINSNTDDERREHSLSSRRPVCGLWSVVRHEA
jgi:hypothetical protein